MHKITIYLIPAALIVIMFACTKDFDDQSIGEIGHDIKLKTRSLNYPTVSDGILVFDDSTHLANYVLGLDEIITANDSLFEVSVQIEGLTSPFNLIHSTNDTFVDDNDRYLPFLTDPIMLSIVNENFEFAVDSVLYTYINNEQLLMCLFDDTNTRDSIRLLKKGIQLNIDSIPSKAFWIEDTDKDFLRPIPCLCSVNIERVDCDLVRIYGGCLTAFWLRGAGQVSIEFYDEKSDPTPEFTLTHNINGNFSIIWESNPLNPFEDYYILVKVSSCDPSQTNTSKVLYFDPNADICDRGERSSGWLSVEDNFGVNRLDHITSVYKNSWYTKEEAWIWSYKHNGAFWHEVGDFMSVTIDASRNDSNCNFLNQDDKDKWGTFYDIRVNLTSPGVPFGNKESHYCKGDVISTFYKDTAWPSGNITATHELDFECCD